MTETSKRNPPRSAVHATGAARRPSITTPVAMSASSVLAVLDQAELSRSDRKAVKRARAYLTKVIAYQAHRDQSGAFE